MAPVASQAGHSHRSTTKINQKAFKTKRLSKGALKEKAKGSIYPTLVQQIEIKKELYG